MEGKYDTESMETIPRIKQYEKTTGSFVFKLKVPEFSAQMSKYNPLNQFDPQRAAHI